VTRAAQVEVGSGRVDALARRVPARDAEASEWAPSQARSDQGRTSVPCLLTGARAKPWCMPIHVEASFSLSLSLQLISFTFAW
jgi:hypothetical protein